MARKTRSRWRDKDPDAEREASRYADPVPSRRYILEVMQETGAPMSAKRLFVALGVEGDRAQDATRRRLGAMIRDGQLMTDRRGQYGLVERMPLIAGRVIGHRDGYGFLVPDEGDEDVYLGARQMRELMHGDRVLVRIHGRDTRGRPEGRLVEVLERNTEDLVGRYVREGGIGFVVPDNPRFQHSVAIPPRHTLKAKPGEMVVARITEQPGKDTQPVGHIVEVLGGADDPGMETEVAIRAHGVPHVWPDAALADARAFGSRVSTAAKRDRLDLRRTPLVTIDGADARDFDDAVYAEPDGDGWRLLVAIADVSHYVAPGTALDDEARHRATSVYFPRRVVPMLPEELSNGLCSLNPRVDRLCMVCDMRVDAQGRVTDARFHEAVMRSAARLTYELVADLVIQRDASLRKKNAELVPHLDRLADVYRALAKARRRRGAIDFDLPEAKMIFGRDGRIREIRPRMRNEAHKIIEECMIAANVQAAKFLKKHRVPTLFRVHGGPEEEKLEELRIFLEVMGVKVPGGAGPLKPRQFAAIVRAVQGRPEEALIETVMLRSLSQAVYQPENIGHFGLALPEYAHFTSPIRRYPDLLVHRGIRHVLRGGRQREYGYRKADVDGLGRQCSMAERRADDATREANDWLKCEYMQDRLGDEFTGVISGVTDFGVFVQIPELQIDGLVHISALGRDYFHRDAARRALVGERSGQRFQLADPIRVRLVRVDLDQRRIDFEPVGDGRRSDDRRGRRGAGRRKGR